MFKSPYVGGKAPCSRVNIVCRRESSILASTLSENMLEGKLHVQELIYLRVCAVQSNPFPLLWEIERELGNSCKKKNSNCGSSGKVSANETYIYYCGNALGEGD